MKAFVDSSFYISLLRQDDSNHARAKRILQESAGRPLVFYTSFLIIDEVATVLSMRVSKKDAIAWLAATEQADFPIILNTDETVRQNARALFKKITDKNISMVDCYCAILMKQNGIQTCFTFDAQFKKLGFEIL